MRASDYDILILPGQYGGTPDHWYARWAAKLSTARRVEQRDFDHPVLADWEHNIKVAAAAANKPAILIGHSMGAVAGCLVAPHLHNIAAAMLVAPPSARVIRTLDGVDPAFANAHQARLSFPALLVASRDDPYATYEEQTERASALGATLVDAGVSGHINPDSGHGPWPEGLMRFAHFLGRLKG